jgi:hypothetical protein
MRPTFYCGRPVTQPYQLFQPVGFVQRRIANGEADEVRTDSRALSVAGLRRTASCSNSPEAQADECSERPATEGNSGTGAAIALTVLFGPIGLIQHGSNLEFKNGAARKAYAGEDVCLVSVEYIPQDAGED